MQRIFAATLLAFFLIAGAAQAAEQRGMRFWNLTANTLTSLQFSPPGKNEWGKNQCENDSNKTIDRDARVLITGLNPGRYDARLIDKSGRTCVVRNVDVTNNTFSIDEKQMTDCQR